MDFDFSEEQNMLRESVARFVTNEYGFAAREQIRKRPKGYSMALWDSFASLGLLALNVPEDYEGLGGGAVENLLVMQELGAGLVQEPYLASAIIGTRTLACLGNEAQRRHWLALVAAGKAMPILAHDEPATRFDRFAIATQAVKQGDAYVLNGAKSVVSHAAGAEPLLVSALLDGQLQVFIVPREAEGVHVLPYRTADGLPAGEVSFKNVRLGADARLDGAADSAAALADVLDIGLAALCAEAIGVLDKMLAATANYLKERKQFGQPIGKFQALQHRMAEMLMHIEQARSMAYLAAVKCTDEDLAARRRVMAAAKVVVGQACRFVGQQAVQLHGGMGVTDELDVSHYFKRLMAIELTAGSTDQHLEDYASGLAA